MFVDPKKDTDKGRAFEFSKAIGDDVVYSEIAPQVPSEGTAITTSAVTLPFS